MTYKNLEYLFIFRLVLNKVKKFDFFINNFKIWTFLNKSKSHFSKLKKAYNETTSKVSTVVSAQFRNSSNSQAELVVELNAHRDAISDLRANHQRPQIFASASLDKTAKVWVSSFAR